MPHKDFPCLEDGDVVAVPVMPADAWWGYNIKIKKQDEGQMSAVITYCNGFNYCGAFAVSGGSMDDVLDLTSHAIRRWEKRRHRDGL